MMCYPKFAGTTAWKVCLCAVAILFVSGCAATTATVELASAGEDEAAKSFISPQGEANIYVTRKSEFKGSSVLFQVVVDGRVEGAIAPGTYHVAPVEPGPHSVSVMTMENQSIQQFFDAVAGENYFFEVKLKTGWLLPKVEVVQLTESDGRAAIAENSLAQDTQPENWPSPKTRAELRAENSCDFYVMNNVLLSKGDECAIGALKNRCEKLDSCFVDCFTGGAGVNIGGGCGHICNYGWMVDWKPPEEARQCYEEGDESYLPS